MPLDALSADGGHYGDAGGGGQLLLGQRGVGSDCLLASPTGL